MKAFAVAGRRILGLKSIDQITFIAVFFCKAIPLFLPSNIKYQRESKKSKWKIHTL